MAHTVTWGAAFDATPAGLDDIKDGDDRIRELKTAVSERLALEHYFTKAGTNNWHGVHTPPYVSTNAGSRTLAITDEIVCCSAACTVTVPLYSTMPIGKRFVVKITGTGTVTIARSGSDTFDGATSLSITTRYNWFEIICTGTTTWAVVSRGYGDNTIAVDASVAMTLPMNWEPMLTGGMPIFCGYAKDPFGYVHLLGGVATSTIGLTPVTTIGAGYRPPCDLVLHGPVVYTSEYHTLKITTAGVVTSSSLTHGTSIYFEGITYKAA